jgi:hypothetical protein
VSEELTAEVRCTPTDPSLEFDAFESVRLRVVEALTRRGYELVESERAALYLVEVSRPVSDFLKVLTRGGAPGDEEVLDAVGKVVDALPALAKAQQLLLKFEPGRSD